MQTSLRCGPWAVLTLLAFGWFSSLDAAPPAPAPGLPPRSGAAVDLPVAGRVNADDYPTLQAAVDALGDMGGEVRLGARAYMLDRPVRIKHRIRFQGVMDAKVRNSVTRIGAAPKFQGEWLFETVPVPAHSNPDLNKDLFFFDLNLTGSATVSGIKAANVDGLRLERCRLASMKHGVLVTQVTDQPRPWHWDISPGGIFVNNCIFRCSGTAIQMEYATQSRIYSNWFVTGCGVALHLKNSDKTWFFSNEINSFERAGILLEDDGLPGNQVTDIFLVNNWINASGPAKKYLELAPHGKDFLRVQFAHNILCGDGTVDTAALTTANGSHFTDNTGPRPGFASSSIGSVAVPPGKTEFTIKHGLFRAPAHVGLTFACPPPSYWVTDCNAETFTVHFAAPLERGSFTWSALTQP